MALKLIIDGVERDATPAEEGGIRAEWSTERQKELAQKAFEQANQYRVEREKEYRPLGVWDVLEALVNNDTAELTRLRGLMQAIQTKHPKP